MALKIPYESLSEDVLVALIESFVLREGTDYGEREISLTAKVEQVRRQLAKGEVNIYFDAESESVSIFNPRDVRVEETTKEP